MLPRRPNNRGGRWLAALLASALSVASGGCAASATSPRDAHDEAGSPPPAHGSRSTRRTVGWVSLAVGAEAAVAAIVTSVMLVHQKSVLDGQCNSDKICSQSGLDAAGAISSLKPWNTGTWIAAAVGLGAGAALVWTSQPDAPAATAITVTPEASGAGLALRSAF